MKKFLSVVLALVMCISVFAGCGDSKNAAKTLDMKTLLQTTVKQLAKEYETVEKNLFGYKPSQDESYCLISVNADKVNIPVGTSSVNSFEASVAAAASNKNNELTVVFDGSVNDVALSVLEMIWGEDVISLASPALIDKTFTLPTKNFADSWNNSIFGSSSYIENVPDLSYSSLFKTNESAKKVGKEFFDLTVDFLSSCEQTNEETQITLNGINTDVTKFTMVVSSDKLKAYLNSSADTIFKIFESDVYDALLSTEDVDLDEVKSELKEMIDEIDFEDVTFYIYGYDKKIVKIEYADVIDDVEALVYLEFKNPDYMLDGMEFAVQAADLETGEVTKCTVNMNGTFVQGDDVLTFDIDVDAEEDGTQLNIADIGINFDYGSNVYSISANINDDGEQESLTLKGECHRGEAFELSFDDITFSDGYSTISVNNMIKKYLGGDVKISFKTMPVASDMEITKTTSTVNALELTENDIENMQGEISENLELLMKKLGISMY